MTAQITAEVNRRYLPENGGGLSCEIDIDPGTQDQPAERHIAICVDSSGSMSKEEKMDKVKDATDLVFGLLNDHDYLSIVSFDTSVEVVMPATRWGDIERNNAVKHVQQLNARGGTDIYSGLEEARDSLEGLGQGEQIAKRILLLSDGRDNDREAPEFKPLAGDIGERAISIYSAGIGDDYDKDIIQTIGEKSQGRWTHVKKPADIKSFFGGAVQEASTVIVNNPRLIIEPVAGSEISEIYRRLPQVQEVDPEYDQDNVIVGLPDLQDQEEQQVVLKMDAPGDDPGSQRLLANVELDAGSRSASTQITVNYTDDKQKLAQQNDDVYLAHQETQIRSDMAKADTQEELDEVKTQIEETEIIAGETQITDQLRDNVTQIEEGDEEVIRETQEETTVIDDESRIQ